MLMMTTTEALTRLKASRSATRTKGPKGYNHNRNYPRFHNSSALDIRFLALEKLELSFGTARVIID